MSPIDWIVVISVAAAFVLIALRLRIAGRRRKKTGECSDCPLGRQKAGARLERDFRRLKRREEKAKRREAKKR